MQLRSYNIIFCVCITLAYYPFYIIAQSYNDQFAEFEKKLYFIGDSKWENWYNSWNFCASKGMKLLSLESERETNFLIELLKSEGGLNKRYWTSGNDLGQFGEYFWFGTGTPIQYSNWKIGEPTGGDEHCIYTDVFNFKWNDFSCDAPARLICERELTEEELNSNLYQPVFNNEETQDNTNDAKTTEATTTTTSRRANRATTSEITYNETSEVQTKTAESTSPRITIDTTTSGEHAAAESTDLNTHIIESDDTTVMATINQENNETLSEQSDAVITESTQEITEVSNDSSIIPQVITSNEDSGNRIIATTTTATTAIQTSDDANHREHDTTDVNQETSTAITTTTTAIHSSDNSNQRDHVTSDINQETSSATTITTKTIHNSDDKNHGEHVISDTIQETTLLSDKRQPQPTTSPTTATAPTTATESTSYHFNRGRKEHKHGDNDDCKEYDVRRANRFFFRRRYEYY